jgi:twinkle protein
MTDIVHIKRMLASQAQAVAEHLLPGGRKESHEWRAGSVSGESGKSLGVHLTGHKAGVWSDFSTGESGDLIDLWMAVKAVDLVTALDEIRAWLGVEKPVVHQPVKKTWIRPAKPKCHEPEGRAMAYLMEDRNLSREAIRAYQIGEDDKGNIIFPFYLPDGTLAMAKRREPVDGAKPVPTAADCEAILFGWQAIPPNARTVVITEGEIDAPSSFDYGHPALSVPFGGGGGGKQKWIENEYDRLARFEKIYLALDMDGPGEEAVSEIADRLGKHRCLRVHLPRKDANACLVEGISRATMAKAIAEATWFDVPGLRDPRDYADNVKQLFWPKDGERVGYRTPYGRLGNKLMFRPGEVTIWTGDSGAGKTQILNDCVVDWIGQGGRTCLSSLEMAPSQTLKRLSKQIVGTDRPTESAIDAALLWASEGLLIYDLVGKQKLDEMLAIFDYARSRYGCDLFVIDSLMRLGVAGDDYNTQETVIFRLVDWTMEAKVHTHLVAHSRKGERERGSPGIEDIKGAMEIGANAFNIISVWRDRRHEENVQQLANSDEAAAAKLRNEKPGVILNVAKQRNGDFEGKIGLWFDQKTYRYRSKDDGQTWKRQYLPENWKEKASA